MAENNFSGLDASGLTYFWKKWAKPQLDQKADVNLLQTAVETIEEEIQPLAGFPDKFATYNTATFKNVTWEYRPQEAGEDPVWVAEIQSSTDIEINEISDPNEITRLFVANIPIIYFGDLAGTQLSSLGVSARGNLYLFSQDSTVQYISEFHTTISFIPTNSMIHPAIVLTACSSMMPRFWKANVAARQPELDQTPNTKEQYYYQYSQNDLITGNSSQWLKGPKIGDFVYDTLTNQDPMLCRIVDVDIGAQEIYVEDPSFYFQGESGSSSNLYYATGQMSSIQGIGNTEFTITPQNFKENDFQYQDGALLAVKFDEEHSDNGDTTNSLSLNGKTYPIQQGRSNWNPNDVIIFMFNNNLWRVCGGNGTEASVIIKSGSKVYYGTSSTPASTITKVVVPQNFQFTDLQYNAGDTLVVKFTYASASSLNTSPSLSLSIGGTKKSISSTNNGCWLAGEVVTFIYTGTYWEQQAGLGSIQAAITNAISRSY